MYRVGPQQLATAWEELQNPAVAGFAVLNERVVSDPGTSTPTVSPMKVSADPVATQKLASRGKKRSGGRVMLEDAPRGARSATAERRSGDAMLYGLETEGQLQRLRRYLFEHGGYELVAVSTKLHKHSTKIHISQRNYTNISRNYSIICLSFRHLRMETACFRVSGVPLIVLTVTLRCICVVSLVILLPVDLIVSSRRSRSSWLECTPAWGILHHSSLTWSGAEESRNRVSGVST